MELKRNSEWREQFIAELNGNLKSKKTPFSSIEIEMRDHEADMPLTTQQLPACPINAPIIYHEVLGKEITPIQESFTYSDPRIP